MRKRLMILSFLAAMLLPWATRAQLTTIVADGTTTNSYIPIYGLWADDYTRSQFIYPATMFEELTPGSEISSLTFFSSTASQNWGAATFDVRLGEVTETTLSNYLTYSYTTVYSGAVTVSNNLMVITFTTPYTYQGGNLMVEFWQTATGTYHSEYFYGVTATGASASGYNSSSTASATFNQRNFLAKMEIEYTPGDGSVCYRVRNIDVSAITSDGFTLTWTDTMNSGASYVIYDMADSSILGTTTDTSYTLTNLDANTLYQVAVVANCNDGGESSWPTVTVRTACGGYTETPYFTNFDDVNDGEIPPCWQALQTGSSGSGTFPSVYNYSTNAYSGPKYFEFESTTGQTEMVVLPAMEDISQKSFTFYASLMNHNFVLEVGVYDGTDFEVVDTINLVAGSGNNWHGSYYPYTVYFANYTGSGEQIAMRVTSSGSYTLMMDDFSVDDFFGCYPVSDLTASGIDSANITLSWEDEYNSGATYIVTYWDATGDTNVEYATDTTVTITGLDANTLYYFEVTASCTGGDATAATGNWRTSCGTTAIPYTEGFESYENTLPPPCWTQLNGNPRVQASYPHTGSKHLYFGGAQPNTIALPPMDMPTGELQVRFWTRPESYTSSSCGSFSVGYMTDLNVDSTFVELANWAYNTFSAYEEKEVPMVGAPDDARIVLRHNSGATNWYWYVDDLVVEPIPACAHPISISASNVTANEADITIVGADGASYRLYWSDGTTTDSTDLTDNTYSFTNLTGSTTYTVSAATLCDDGSVTSTVSTSFRTDCEAGSCDVVVNMVDSYGDGWNGAAVQGFIGSDQVFNATFTTGTNGTFTYSLCASDTLVLKWETGSYDSETSFTITHGGNPIANGGGSSYSNGSVIATAAGCPVCSAPSGFVIDSVSDTEVTFHWNADGATEWVVVFNGDTNNATTTTNNSMSFTGLSANTVYTVAIMTDCGDEELSMPLSTTFRTACGAITNLPWTEDFNSFATTSSATNIPCWDYIGTTGYVNITSSYSHSGNCLRFYPSSSSNPDHIILLPIFDTVISGLEMSFWTRPESASSSGSFSVGYVTDSGAFVEMLNVPCSMGTTHMMYEVTFPNAPAGSRIAMRHNVGSTAWYWYVDDIEVHALSSCPKPLHFTLDAISNDSAYVSWNEGGSATSWELAIGPAGFSPDSVTPVTSYDSSFIFTGLVNGTPYDIYVRADCGAEQSLWVGPITATPGQYVIGISGADTISMCGGVIYDDGGVSGQYSSNVDYTLVINPTQADSILTIYGTFTHESCCDHLYIYEGVGTSGTVLWQDGGSTTETVPLCTSLIGPITVKFHSDGSIVNDGFELFVNCIAGPTCPTPLNLTASDITSSSATLSWSTSGAETEWLVTMNGVTSVVTSVPYTVTGLDAMAHYNVTVTAVCGAGDTSYSSAISFVTAMCDNVVTATNFDSTNTVYSTGSSYSPIGYSLYDYSFVQIIVDSAKIASLAGSEITAFAFMPLDDDGAEDFNYMDVYLANVNESSLSSDFITPDSSHEFVQVINNGNFNFTEDDVDTWVIHAFDTTFTWDGHSNVLVTVNRRNGDWSSTSYFAAHNQTGDKMRYAYRDDSEYNFSNVSGQGYTSNYVGDIQFISCGAGCATPTATVSNITAQSATVTAHGNGLGYELEYGTDNADLGNTMTSTNGVFAITGLQPETQYFYAVRQQCDTNLYSNWKTGSFTTDELGCLAPTNLAAISTDYTSATLGWTIGNEETAWEVHVFNATYDTIVTANTTGITVNGLDNNRSFSAAVRAMCGADNDVEGPWSDTISFATDSCYAVTNIQTNVTSTTAIISWTGSSASYRIAYMELPFNMNDAEQVTVNTNSYTITGLYAETQYGFVIINNCAEGVNTATGVQTFTTLESGVDPTYYHINVVSNNNDWGTVTGTGNYQEGATVTLTATANEGYHFEQWNDGNTNATRTITVTGDATYTAFFAEDGTVTTYYTVTVTSNNDAWGTVSGGGQYAEGSTATITATPASGYRFVEWNDGNTQNPRSFTVTADVAYVATFEATEGIGDVVLGTVSLYPNPASTSVTLGLDGFEGEVSVDIVDMNGRVITQTITQSSTHTITFDVNDMPQGAYFVRVVSGTRTAVSKLIVK